MVRSLEMTNRVARRERRRVAPKEKAETQRLALVAEIEEALRTVAGVRTNELAHQLAAQIANLQLWNKSDGTANNVMTAVNLLAEMKPETPTEAMLAVQMIGVHHLATMSLARANGEGQSFEGIKEHTLLATRLMRLFNDQLDARAKLKGFASQQKVTVEHVHVHEGGQAIVGAVNSSKRGGEGVNEQAPHGTP